MFPAGPSRQGRAGAGVKVVHRSSGSAWPGATGEVVKVTGDRYTVRWNDGG